VGEFQDGEPERRFDFEALATGLNEGHLRHLKALQRLIFQALNDDYSPIF
jgi:hypothetical protein